MMVAVKTVKIDGEPIHIFNGVIYIFESSSGVTLEVDVIVSEVVKKRYKNEETLIVEIELEDGRIINSIMRVKVLSGKLPQLSMFTEIDEPDEYPDFLRVNDTSLFPNIEEGITIEEIRKVEMPNEKITLKLNLPIDQTEWLAKQKNAVLNDLFKELIYDFWRKQHS
jgi:hypothetical protein